MLNSEISENSKPTISKSLQKLLAAWQAAVVNTSYLQPPVYGGSDVEIVNLVEHTAAVVAGSCFIARVRETSDGHPYIRQAIEAGAAVVIGQRDAAALGFEIPSQVVYLQVSDTAEAVAWLAAAWHGFPSRNLTVVGVTGTNGKTTVINLLYSILQTAGFKTGMISTIKAIIGDLEEPTGLHVSTPEAPVVQAYLRRMVDAGVTHCLLETTSHGLAQHRVSAVDFDVGAITNFTHEHIDYHGSLDAYFAAKARLFTLVSQGTSILNRDDNSCRDLAQIARGDIVLFGIDLPAHVMAAEVVYGKQGTAFTLQIEGEQPVRIESRLTGKFNVSNMLTAATIAHVLGVGASTIQAGLEAIVKISGRMQPIERGQAFQVMVDFAHTHDALEKAIEAARPLVTEQNGRVITVFGSAGKRDIEKRRLMAEVSARDADVTVLTAEDPRTERLADILEMMASGCRSQGGVEGDTFWRVPDRGEAIYFALTLANPEDVVLVCGKGHEQSMCFGTTEFPWDDRKATAAALDAFLAQRPMVDLGLPTFGNF